VPTKDRIEWPHVVLLVGIVMMVAAAADPLGSGLIEHCGQTSETCYAKYCMGRRLELWHPRQAMPHTLEDKILELCAKAVAAKDSEQLSPILSDLRAALHEQDQLAKVLMAERTRMLNPNVNR
jgi:hypothetical protein